MCLVSYVSLGEDDYCISSNRDEFLDRATAEIVNSEIRGQQVYCPIDVQGGSWIFASNSQRSICLLNGAFVNHRRQLPYRMSRGLIMKAFYGYMDAASYLHQIELANIEPFTMIIREPRRLLEFRWDGSLKHILRLDTRQHYVWSSSTLYEPVMIAQRASWFFDLINTEKVLSPEVVKRVHQAGGQGNQNIGFLMNRNDRVKTISISQIIHNGDRHELNHQSLMNQDGEIFIEHIKVLKSSSAR